LQLTAIGVIHSPFQQASGTPIQSRAAEGVEGTVEIFPRFVAGLKDLEGFERIWLLYWFDRAAFGRPMAVRFLCRQVRAVAAPC